LGHVWHPALFLAAICAIVLSSIVLVVAHAHAAMSRIESKSQPEEAGLHAEATKARNPTAHAVTLRVDRRILRLLITFATVAPYGSVGRCGMPVWWRHGRATAQCARIS
jgi:hypothetical protein